MITVAAGGTAAPTVENALQILASDGTVEREWLGLVGLSDIPFRLPDSDAIYTEWQASWDEVSSVFRIIAPFPGTPGVYSARIDRGGEDISASFRVCPSSESGEIEEGETAYISDDGTAPEGRALLLHGTGFDPWEIVRNGSLVTANGGHGGTSRGLGGWCYRPDTTTAGRGILHCPAFRAEYGERGAGIGDGYYLRSLSSVDSDEDVYAPFQVLERTCCDDASDLGPNPVVIEIDAANSHWTAGVMIGEGNGVSISIPSDETIAWETPWEFPSNSATPNGINGPLSDYSFPVPNVRKFGVCGLLLSAGITPAPAPDTEGDGNFDGQSYDSHTFAMSSYDFTLSPTEVAALVGDQAYPIRLSMIVVDNKYNDNSRVYTATLTRF